MLVASMNTSYQIHLYLNVIIHCQKSLEEQKKASGNAEKSKKRSLMLDEISEVKKKEMNIEQCIISLKSNI